MRAPPGRQLNVNFLSWKFSNSGRCPTLMMVACGNSRARTAVNSDCPVTCSAAKQKVNRDKHGKYQCVMESCRRILCAQGIKKIPVPEIDAVGDSKADKHHQSEADRHGPRQARTRRFPVTSGTAQEAAQQKRPAHCRRNTRFIHRVGNTRHSSPRYALCTHDHSTSPEPASSALQALT